MYSEHLCARTLHNRLPVPQVTPTAVPSTQRIVVCVKGLDFDVDNSRRLVEWLEAQRLMGADKVMMYAYSMHWRTARVLQHYKPFVDIAYLKLPGKHKRR